MPTAIITIANGHFVESGAVPDGVTYAQVTVSRNPDPRREKWSGADIVAKTAPEIADYDATKKAVVRDADLAVKAIKALATAIHKRFKAQIPTDTTTAAQWEASLKAEYDAL